MTKELGVSFMVVAVPTVLAGDEKLPEELIGTIVLMQPVRFAHPSLVTKTVWFGVVLNRPETTRITFAGYTGWLG
jgi:hypothetical protein